MSQSHIQHDEIALILHDVSNIVTSMCLYTNSNAKVDDLISIQVHYLQNLIVSRLGRIATITNSNLIRTMNNFIYAFGHSLFPYTIIFQPENKDIVVKVPKSAMIHILLNIFSNAGEAVNKQNPTLLINISMINNKHVTLSVRDNGCGVPADIKDNIFNKGTSTKESGLGLYGVNRIIMQYGGTIDIHSVVGEYTQVNVTLPLAKNKITVKNTVTPPVLRKKYSCIIIDDDIYIKKYLSKTLISMNLLVRHVKNYDNLPDNTIVFLDYNLNYTSSIDIYNTIRSTSHEIVIIFMSGMKINLPYNNSKNTYFLEKPYSIDDIIHILHQL